MSKLQLNVIMFLMSYDHTDIWTLQRWIESLNWGWKNGLLPRNCGEEKVPCFFSPLRWSFGNSDNFQCLESGEAIWLTEQIMPWKPALKTQRRCSRLPPTRAVGRAVPSPGMSIWWHKAGEKERSPWNVLIWRVLGFVEPQDCFSQITTPELCLGSTRYSAKGHGGVPQTGTEDTGLVQGIGSTWTALFSSGLWPPTHQSPWWSSFKEQEASLKR